MQMSVNELRQWLEQFIANISAATLGRIDIRDVDNEALATLRDDGIEGVTPLIRQKTRRVDIALAKIIEEINTEDLPREEMIDATLDDLVDIAGYAGLCTAIALQLKSKLKWRKEE
jgi:hypothetical protein